MIDWPRAARPHRYLRRADIEEVYAKCTHANVLRQSNAQVWGCHWDGKVNIALPPETRQREEADSSMLFPPQMTIIFCLALQRVHYSFLLLSPLVGDQGRLGLTPT